MYTREQQDNEAKRIAERARLNAIIRYEKKEKEKEKKNEYIDIVLEKEFKKLTDEEIIRMGKSPKTQREIWDKEINEEFEKSKYKYI